MSLFASLLQADVPLIPSIPDNITDEGILAVLFMVILGMLTLLFMLSKGYLRLGPSADKELAEKIAALIASNDQLSAEQRGIRENLHKNVIPMLAGLSLAYLKISGLNELAEREKARFKKDGIDPKPPI